MTVEKLYRTLNLILKADSELKLQASLEQVRESLTNLANQPAATQWQTSLANGLSSLTSGAQQLPEIIGPVEASAVAQLGGSEYFDPSIAAKVREAVEKNAMTPAVARDFVQNLATRRAAFLQNVQTNIQSIDALGILSRKREVSPAEAAFSIPKELFDGKLGSFAKELQFINHLFENLSEASTGEAESAKLEALSSSTPTVIVIAGIGVLKLLADVINSFLDGWQKVQKIRGLREELKQVGSKTAVEEMTEKITTTVNEVVEESTRLSLTGYPKDGGRKHELSNAIERDMRRLFGQIERGLTVEIKINSDAESVDEQEKQTLKSLGEIARNMRFPEVSREPMLLTAGEVLEGEIATSKVTRKSTTTERAVRKGVPGEKTDE